MINYNRMGNNSAILAHSSQSSYTMLTEEAILQKCSYKICINFTGEHPCQSVIN